MTSFNQIQSQYPMTHLEIIPWEYDDPRENNDIPNGTDDLRYEYINLMVQPYVDSLKPLTSFAEINAWMEHFNKPEHDFLYRSWKDQTDLLFRQVDNHDNKFVEDIKEIIVNEITTHFRAVVCDIINIPLEYPTPWDIAKYRNEELLTLFGQGIDALPVDITIGANKYQHMLSGDFVYGLTTALERNPEILVSLYGNRVTSGEFVQRFLQDENVKYTALIRGEYQAFFNSPDFIQGIITGANWINQDPHQIVTELVEIQKQEDGTRTGLVLNFS